jgi:hypothetical protein
MSCNLPGSVRSLPSRKLDWTFIKKSSFKDNYCFTQARSRDINMRMVILVLAAVLATAPFAAASAASDVTDVLVR